MNRLSFYAEYIIRCHKELGKLSKRINTPRLYLWYDFIKCSIVHGAILNHYTRGGLHSLKGCERKKSLTYGRILKVYKKCNDAASIPILNNKHLFNAYFAPFVTRQWLYSKDMTFEQFEGLCDKCEQLIVKPEDGVEGVGIKKIRTPKLLSERKTLFQEMKGSSYMIEEIIEQHPEMVFNNTSVNTVRAHSMIDRNGEVHILKMLLRAGVGESVVDNYAHGGCVYDLNTTTGHIISPSLMKTGEEVYIHPGTDIFMLGRKVPNWDKVVNGVVAAHKLLPQCRFIGWDVAVTQTGIELIEGNHNPDYELYEFFGTKGWYDIIKKYI
ncbi:MAG: hypothetical protein HDS04_05090 [Bacteroides sp.]|nr:hypothetical protein [Bacteroides sp.]